MKKEKESKSRNIKVENSKNNRRGKSEGKSRRKGKRKVVEPESSEEEESSEESSQESESEYESVEMARAASIRDQRSSKYSMGSQYGSKPQLNGKSARLSEME